MHRVFYFLVETFINAFNSISIPKLKYLDIAKISSFVCKAINLKKSATINTDIPKTSQKFHPA